MKCVIDADGWVRCPVCGCKTRTKVRPDTVLERFPLFCPKCHRESVIDFRAGFGCDGERLAGQVGVQGPASDTSQDAGDLIGTKVL